MSGAVATAALGFVLWGLFPLYFRLVPQGPALEILSNRIVWATLLLAIVITWRGGWGWLRETARRPRVLGAFLVSAALLSVNWLTYIWSVNNHHVVDASLGYFVTPLVNVALGYGLLNERPSRMRWLALSFAALGVVWLTFDAGRLPWIGLVIGLSFGAYGLMRKVAALGALEGLTLETLLLAPFALAGMAWGWGHSATSFPSPELATNLWLIGLGPVTAIPLLLFASGARRLSLTTLGVLQYLSPTLQFVIGLALFDEQLTSGRIAGFGFIWAALVIYSVDSWRSTRDTALARNV